MEVQGGQVLQQLMTVRLIKDTAVVLIGELAGEIGIAGDRQGGVVEAETTIIKIRGELKKDIVYKNGIQYPREPKDLPRFLPRLCEKYGGPERFLAAPSTWNYDLHEIRRLLDEGKVQDMATKKEKGGGAR